MISDKKNYPAIEAAVADVEAGLAEARRTGKRVIMIFGADWCPDCGALQSHFDEEANAELVAQHFVLVHVNVGMKDANLEIAQQYGIAVKAIPALSVVEGDGSVVYAQGDEFSNARSQEPGVVTAFLNKWKT